MTRITGTFLALKELKRPSVGSSTTEAAKRKSPVPESASESLLRIGRNCCGIAQARRVAPLVDGDAYYWSSVDPFTHDGYPEKLIEMSEAVHADGGLWVAPAAPGFDARLLGGQRAIERRDGETLRAELNAALQSSPDVIGLISWNEFSENSHIEPSQEHGNQYLDVIGEVLPIIPSPR